MFTRCSCEGANHCVDSWLQCEKKVWSFSQMHIYSFYLWDEPKTTRGILFTYTLLWFSKKMFLPPHTVQILRWQDWNQDEKDELPWKAESDVKLSSGSFHQIALLQNQTLAVEILVYTIHILWAGRATPLQQHYIVLFSHLINYNP